MNQPDFTDVSLLLFFLQIYSPYPGYEPTVLQRCFFASVLSTNLLTILRYGPTILHQCFFDSVLSVNLLTLSGYEPNCTSLYISINIYMFFKDTSIEISLPVFCLQIYSPVYQPTLKHRHTRRPRSRSSLPGTGSHARAVELAHKNTIIGAHAPGQQHCFTSPREVSSTAPPCPLVSVTAPTCSPAPARRLTCRRPTLYKQQRQWPAIPKRDFIRPNHHSHTHKPSHPSPLLHPPAIHPLQQPNPEPTPLPR